MKKLPFTKEDYLAMLDQKLSGQTSNPLADKLKTAVSKVKGILAK